MSYRIWHTRKVREGRRLQNFIDGLRKQNRTQRTPDETVKTIITRFAAPNKSASRD